MNVVNAQLIQQCTSQSGLTGKFILSDSGVVFFPTSQQHNSVKLNGLSYEDDYRGNALAGTFGAARIDIRYHKDFSDERVRNIWSLVCAHSDLAFLMIWDSFYQGRKL